MNSSFLPPSFNPQLFSPWPHRLALLTTIATFPLLFVGGLVTSMGAGLAVPDWPTTFGYNMFLYPWAKMVGGIFYEHSHRLIGSLVGLLTVALAATLWWKESQPWLRWLGVVALVAVIIQGVLGGLRVVLLQHTLAIIHACFAQAFFVLAASLTLFTSMEWRTPPVQKRIPDGDRIRRLALLTVVLMYGQLICGAVLRHTGEWAVVHFVGAALVALHIALLSVRVRQSAADIPGISRPAILLDCLLIFQLLLGLGAYVGKYTEIGMALNPFLILLATSHVVVGAFMLVTGVVLTLRAYRILRPLPSSVAAAQMVSEQVPA